MINQYKAIFCNIDVTLVVDNKNVSDETKDIIKRLIDDRIYFVLTSGKPISMMKKTNELLDVKSQL